MLKRIILLLCLCVVLSSPAFCDTLILKSGKQVDGSITQRTDDAVKLDIEGVEITYYISDIDSINGEKIIVESVTVEPAEKVLEKKEIIQPDDLNTVSGQQLDAINTGSANQPSKEMQTLGEFAIGASSVSGDEDNANWRVNSGRIRKMSPGEAKKVAVVTGVAALILIVFSVLIYVYSSLCVYFIAKKINIEPAWLAWVPIANVFLMCKMAGLSYMWLLGAIGLFIPIVNILANIYFIGLTIFMWYKIAIARGRPGWVGILTIIPIANLVIMGYLAFSE